MKKVLTFICISLFCMVSAESAVRTTNQTSRNKNNVVSTTNSSTRTKTSRAAVKTTVSTRAAKPVTVLTPKTTSARSATTTKTPTRTSQNKKITARATASSQVSAQQKSIETKTGAAYEQCKTAFFTCMDQFCQLKNDKFRRCSCSDRVFEIQEISENYQQVSEQITEFSENLDTVGMTYEQAKAMKTASEGEDALTEDKSASKQLLQAIMGVINGEKASVGGKYKDLNSIDLSSDMSNAFGMDESGQIIASYNGTNLYKAVYPKCKSAMTEDCNSASLQRAINAYLMAVEQDCNTVESALKTQQKTLKASVKQSSAMLDLARVENRQKHNSDDVATCLVNVENAVLSEEVCGAKYHKCLDYGQFIDVSTGAPLTGVTDFYKLGQLLTFKNTENIKDQKLSSMPGNRTFVQFFENKTKKFAEDALDKCSEKADEVWKQYLDRALLDIYYAQQDKVDEVQQSCMDLVSACYENQNTAIASAMAALTGDSSINLKPGVIELTTQMCSNYIESCNNMFSGDVINKYLANKDSSDSITACRAVAQKCFDSFGGTGYENFYYPYSGLFEKGRALDWFTLYQYKMNDQGEYEKTILSPCAQELHKVDGCMKEDILERVFGGFNKYEANEIVTYGLSNKAIEDINNLSLDVSDRQTRSRGVATEIYYKIIDNLSTQCSALNGYFVEHQYAEQYGYYPDNTCNLNTEDITSIFKIDSNQTKDENSLYYWYKFLTQENICPANYINKVDVSSWGACSCWENGGFRSQNGVSQICMPLLPVPAKNVTSDNIPVCTEELLALNTSSNPDNIKWCQNNTMSSLGQLCPRTKILGQEGNAIKCAQTVVTQTQQEVEGGQTVTVTNSQDLEISAVGLYVPHHKKEVEDSDTTGN